MNSLLFLFGCIGVRLCLALIAKYVSKEILRIMGIIALVIAVSFMVLYIFDLRKTGAEAGGKIWWNQMRPLHACMYLLFALYAFKQKNFAWIVLLIDALMGLFVWILHKTHILNKLLSYFALIILL